MAEQAKASIVERGVERVMGWVNALTGNGMKGGDVRVNSVVTWAPMGEEEAAWLYAADSMAAKINDKIVDDATKRGYKWTGIDDDDAKALVARLKDLDFDASMISAWKKARMYGGSGIFKLYGDNLDVEQPRTGNEPIKSLLVLSRYELRAPWEDRNKNVLSGRFGLPVYYTFAGRAATDGNNTSLKIHWTRVVRFVGAYLPEVLESYTEGWGDSYLNRPKDAIRNYTHAHDSINMAIKDLSVAVFKIKGLGDMLVGGADGDKQLTDRLAAVNLSKSIARAVVIDSEGEDFDYRTRNLTGASDLVTQAGNRLAAETDMPQTVLFGSSPTGGLGQSGNHESENWYAAVESAQSNYLKPKMLEIAWDVCVELGIDPENLDVEFNKLWQMSDKETAEIKNIMAQVDERYHNMGVLDSYEITSSRFGGPKYSIETTVDMKARERQEREAEPVEPPQLPGRNDSKGGKK